MSTLRLGVSACLLGNEVRYDGGHKRHPFLTDLLGPFVEWVPGCPEVEAGFGTPREAMPLVGSAGEVRLVTVRTRHDVTSQLQKAVTARLRQLATLDLDGMIAGIVPHSDVPADAAVERLRAIQQELIKAWLEDFKLKRAQKVARSTTDKRAIVASSSSRVRAPRTPKAPATLLVANSDADPQALDANRPRLLWTMAPSVGSRRRIGRRIRDLQVHQRGTQRLAVGVERQ